MTDKQIMVDGVDVSKCDNYISDYQIANMVKGGYEHIKDVCECGERGIETFNFNCKDNPNCYFKQLARKEQECGKWKNAYEVKEDALEEAEEYIEELEEKYHKVHEQLKAEKAKLEAQIEADTQYHVKEECNLRKIIRNKEKRNVELYKENNQLKALKEQAEQKLGQIKPILEYYANSYIGEKQLDGRYRYDLGNANCILYDPRKAEEGLKIINEVENE